MSVFTKIQMTTYLAHAMSVGQVYTQSDPPIIIYSIHRTLLTAIHYYYSNKENSQ